MRISDWSSDVCSSDLSKVRAINIIGNEVFSDGDLRSEMATKQARWFRLFSSGTSYDPDRMAYDQQKLRQFYLTNGYADFRVASAVARSEEHTSELQSLMRISYADFCLKKTITLQRCITYA